MLAVREDAVKHKVVPLFSRLRFSMPSVIQFICTCTIFRIQCSEKSATLTCGFRSLLSDRVTLSTPKPMSSGKRFIALWHQDAAAHMISQFGKGATRQCSRCSGLESAITTDHCSPIVVPHPPSRCLRIRRRREVGSRFTSRQVDESFRGVC
ncbi:uncharacterized protein [Triticum aestivum]|uniref:uncharacterized protein isoform X1 n=1 Tax=Triticum aestivum TaxID=4565 RepID=UPI001D01308B|nr:uncharacterized protein LOC123045040 isoform X1 [Triticum aestivum]XP_044323887.1 uncharacterized protein LOC123045040 isoform X1 [Triticum aestivum]